MSVIGFRCFPDGFSYVVLEGRQEEPEVVVYDRFVFPTDLSWGAKLGWLRKQVLEVLRQHNVSGAGLKGPEPKAQRKSLPRSEVEGVIKEAVFSMMGRECTPRIKSQLRRDIAGFTDPARYLDRVLTSRNLAELNNPLYQDAALAAIAELPEEE